MEPIRLLHFADLHVGIEAFGSIDPCTGVTARVLDFLARFDELIAYALAHEADLVIFSGDAFKTRSPSPTYQRAFAKRIKRLSDAGIPVVLLVGNHDLPTMTQRASTLDIFRTLDNLRVGLMTNDVDLIRSTLEPLDKIRDRVITTRAQVGARMSGIESALSNMGKKNVFNAELQSNIEDSDIIQVVSDMAREETVLRASLQASNKLIQPTLLDFLR